jgi:uncharacterized protein YjbI with pentapeptide repeats
LKDQVEPLNAGSVNIDLSRDELFGISWAGVQFGWLGSAYMPRIDLRGVNLAEANLSGADLAGAFLQCADLRGADLRGANLNDADLRGANVAGANFTKATLKHTRLTHVYGTAQGIPPGLPEAEWNSDPQACENTSSYWHQPPG